MFEYKVKTTDNKNEEWENLPVHTGTQKMIESVAKMYNVWEVRYNSPGSQQGNYIPGKKYRK